MRNIHLGPLALFFFPPSSALLFMVCDQSKVFERPSIASISTIVILVLCVSPLSAVSGRGRGRSVPGSYSEQPPSGPMVFYKEAPKGSSKSKGRTFVKYARGGESGLSAVKNGGYPLPPPVAAAPGGTPGVAEQALGGPASPGVPTAPGAAPLYMMTQNGPVMPGQGEMAAAMAGAPGMAQQGVGMGMAGKMPQFLSNASSYVQQLHIGNSMLDADEYAMAKGQTYAQFGGGQFYQSLFGGKGGFNPLQFLLGRGSGGGAAVFVPVPVVVPPPPPPPSGPDCYTNDSGFLCCNATLEKTMENAFMEFKSEGYSFCNAQKMASIVAEAAEKMFGVPFESIAAHRDFVAKINFAGDLNCKIEVDGKYILAYASPQPEQEAAELLETNGTEPSKPTYIVYGPIR